MSTFSKFLPSKGPRNDSTAGAAASANYPDSPTTPADFNEKQKRDSDVLSTAGSVQEELTTVADPSLNPGVLSFEEGWQISSLFLFFWF